MRTQGVVVIGYTAGGGRRGLIGALLLAVVNGSGSLRHSESLGSGFIAVMLRDLHRMLVPLECAAAR